VSRPTGQELKQFFFKVDQIPELRGAGVGYVGDGICDVLRDSHHSSGLQTFVVIKATDIDTSPSPSAVAQPSLALELAGLGLNCAGAVLSWGAFVGEVAAVPVSGGTTAALSLLTWTAAGATSLQCLNSIVRSYDVAVQGGEWTVWLDSHDFYVDAAYILDGISLAGAAAAGAATVRTVLALERATGRELPDILKGLSRAERKRLTQEIIRMQRPGISNSVMKSLIRAGTFPTRFASTEITQALFGQLRDAISATLAFGSSATSGVLRLIYVDVFQE
jgi:hypothetical protein